MILVAIPDDSDEPYTVIVAFKEAQYEVAIVSGDDDLKVTFFRLNTEPTAQ